MLTYITFSLHIVSGINGLHIIFYPYYSSKALIWALQIFFSIILIQNRLKKNGKNAMLCIRLKHLCPILTTTFLCKHSWYSDTLITLGKYHLYCQPMFMFWESNLLMEKIGFSHQFILVSMRRIGNLCGMIWKILLFI
jgi:hypothetical protein